MPSAATTAISTTSARAIFARDVRPRSLRATATSAEYPGSPASPALGGWLSGSSSDSGRLRVFERAY